MKRPQVSNEWISARTANHLVDHWKDHGPRLVVALGQTERMQESEVEDAVKDNELLRNTLRALTIKLWIFSAEASAKKGLYWVEINSQKIESRDLQRNADHETIGPLDTYRMEMRRIHYWCISEVNRQLGSPTATGQHPHRSSISAESWSGQCGSEVKNCLEW